MAQFDLLLTQNVSLAGTEFSEKYVNIAKGALLSGAVDGTPTVLAVGTDTYVLTANAATATGLEWVAQSGGHTQNTDVGTTSAIFELDSDSYKIELTAESASKFGVKVDGGATYADLQAKDATFASVLSDDIKASAAAATPDIYSEVTTGTIAVGAGLTTGTLNIDTVGTDTHAVNIGTGVSATGKTKTINIGTGGDTGSVTAINLGSTIGTTVTVNDDLVVTGNLTVNGTTSTINSTTLQVDDKNIELGTVDTPDDTTADGGGITLKGSTDKTIIWDNANDNWTLNQNVNIPTGTVYKINNTEVLSSTQVLGVTLGTMAAEAATSYVANSVFDANTVLFATSDNTPAALLGTELPPKLWAEVPADKIGTGWTGTAVAGQIARDDNWLYVCKTGGTATNQAWLRSALATNWS